MFIIFNQGGSGGGGGGVSTNPGEENVLDGVEYYINDVLYTGEYISAYPTADQLAAAVWDQDLADHVTAGTFGSFVQKLLTVAKFLGLK